jgi:protease-4
MPIADSIRPFLSSLIVFILLVGAASGTARAQAVSDDGVGPTRGVFIPGRAIAGDADSSAVELNPGQLAQMVASDLVVVGDPSAADASLPGRGAALFFGGPLFLSSYWGIGLEGSARSTTPAVIDGRTKLELAYALRLGRAFGLGVSWGHLFGEAYGGTDTFDAGASWRLFGRAAVGLVAQDLNRPRPFAGADALPRVWTGELTIRPLATDRLEIAGAAVHVEADAWRRVVPRLRAIGRVVDGLRLFAEVETVPRGGDFAFSGGADYRVTGGLWIDFDHLGGAFALRAARPGAGDNGWGGSVLLRVTGERFPSLVQPAHVERVSLEHIDTDREFLALVLRLRALAADDGVAGVLLKVEGLELGLARIEEVRELIDQLRRRGKKVVAYAVSPSTREYYLASACDRIVVHPAGSVTLNGLAQNVTFYKQAMDTLGINVDLVRIAEFKGAMEPFILTQQSPAVRRNKEQILDDVYQRLVAAVSQRGGALSPERVRGLIDRGLFTAPEAEALGLIDAVHDEGEVGAYVGQVLGRPGIAVRDPDPGPGHPEQWKPRRIAVVLVDGTIVDSASQQLPFDLGSVAGADTLAAALQQCKDDRSIAAVVLRVNSPGGSAFASDVIARSLAQVRAAGKPVVVSMGDYAASGGYYVAAPSDLIFADPSTITGSIGIFGFKVDVQKLLANLGVSVETFRRGKHADYLSPYRPWTDDELKLVSEKIRHFYELFLATVSAGRQSRGITIQRADELGRGHIWTGAQAVGLGLVDRTGGLGAAIDYAAGLVGLPPGRGGLPDLAVLPRSTSSALQKLIGLASEVGADAGDAAADGDGPMPPGARERPPLTPAELEARLLAGPGSRAALRLLAPLLIGADSGIEARMPFDLEIR